MPEGAAIARGTLEVDGQLTWYSHAENAPGTGVALVGPEHRLYLNGRDVGSVVWPPLVDVEMFYTDDVRPYEIVVTRSRLDVVFEAPRA